MKKTMTCVIALLFATAAISFAAPDKKEIMEKENAAWQAFKDKNAEAFKKVVDKDVRVVYADGVSDMAKEVAEMQKWDVKSFTISDFDTFSDEKDVVVATYMVKTEATHEGKDMSGTYVAGTVWKLENGAWMAIFHTHMKQEPAAK